MYVVCAFQWHSMFIFTSCGCWLAISTNYQNNVSCHVEFQRKGYPQIYIVSFFVLVNISSPLEGFRGSILYVIPNTCFLFLYSHRLMNVTALSIKHVSLRLKYFWYLLDTCPLLTLHRYATIDLGLKDPLLVISRRTCGRCFLHILYQIKCLIPLWFSFLPNLQLCRLI